MTSFSTNVFPLPRYGYDLTHLAREGLFLPHQEAEGNPILSIHQSDMIIYSVNLHHYFLVEFGDLCGISREDWQQLKATYRQEERAGAEAYRAIPFWSEFIFGDIM